MRKIILTCVVLLPVLSFQCFAQIIQEVKEINTALGGSSYPNSFTVSNNKLFFVASDNTGIPKLWVTTGTDAATQSLTTGGSSLANLADYNNKLYFSYNDGINGTELWSSDGTVAGTALFADLTPGSASSTPVNSFVCNNKLFFVIYNGFGQKILYVTDGTPGGTFVVKGPMALVSGGERGFPVLNNELYFNADNGTGSGWGLWKTDGTLAGTVLVKPDIVTSDAPGMYAVLNSKLYLNVADNTNGNELWVSDGTTAGTHIVKNLRADGGGIFGNGNPQGMTVYNNKLYFSGADDTHGMELFVTDGTDAGTQLVKDVLPGISGSLPYQSTVFNGLLYFTCWGLEQLWQTDGTDAGTVLVKDVLNYTRFATTWNGKMYLISGDNTAVWESNGTTAGTGPIQLTNTINPVSNYGTDFYFTQYNGEPYFAGNCLLITSGFEPTRLSLGAGGGLPLTLLSFTGAIKQNNDLLKWTTAGELNTDYFSVEQSSGGSIFKTVAKVKALGTTAGNQNYSFAQSSILNPGGFYRLKMVDINEAFTYSPIIKLKRDTERIITAVYNSATKQIRLSNYSNVNYKWQLASLGGSILNRGNAGQGLTTINSANLAAGTYVVICTANNMNQNFKLVIY